MPAHLFLFQWDSISVLVQIVCLGLALLRSRWGTHGWSLENQSVSFLEAQWWFRIEHRTQAGPLRGETGTLPGVIKVSTLFPLVVEWYKSETADGHPAIITGRTCQRIEPTLKEAELEIKQDQVLMTSFESLDLAMPEVIFFCSLWSESRNLVLGFYQIGLSFWQL